MRLDDTFWQARDSLRYLRDVARARRVSPDALLVAALVRTAVDVDPLYRLPALVGGPGSLNLFAVIVGAPGSGKSAVLSASDDLRPWDHRPEHPGSGEGLAALFVRRVRRKDADGQPEYVTEQHTRAVLLTADEIDGLTALSDRQGSTLLSTLRTTWAGGSFGWAYADPTKKVELHAHSYRLGLLVNAQPTGLRRLFDDRTAGTPQRFLYVDASDPDAPDEQPDDPALVDWWRVPEMTWTGHVGAPREIGLDNGIRAEILERRVARLRGEDDPSVDEQHGTLLTLRVATMFALIDKRARVGPEDWHLAEQVLEMSRATRDGAAHVLALEDRARGVRKAVARAFEDDIVDERRERTATDRAASTLARHVQNHRQPDGCTRQCLLPAMRSAHRDLFPRAIDLAVQRGLVDTVKRPDQSGRGGGDVDVYMPGGEAR